MNQYKAQVDCLKTIHEFPGRAGWCQVDDEKVFLTPEGYRGFIFRQSDLLLDILKFRVMEDKGWLEKTEQDKEFFLTRHILKHFSYPVQKVVCPEMGSHAWIRPKFLKRFQNPIIYGSDPLKRFLVYEDTGKEIELVGVVLPVRIGAEDEKCLMS